MQVFLHLGAHKTATTLLQRTLFINREYLQDKGVQIILLRQTVQLLGSWASGLCEDPSVLSEALADLKKSGAKKVIISCEDLLGMPFKRGVKGLYPTSPKRFSALAKALAGHDVTSIVYIRPQDEFLESWYLQTINMGNFHSFEDWLKLIDQNSISWKTVIDNVRMSLRPGKVIVEDFRNIRKGTEEFVMRFLAHLEIPYPLKIPKSETHNVSLSEKGLKIALLVFPFLDNAERITMRKFLQSKFSNKDLPRPELLSAAEKQSLAARWIPEYRKLLDSP